VAVAQWLWRRPVRGLRNTVLAHPRLREPADRLLRTVGEVRSRGRSAGPGAAKSPAEAGS
jgi:hypothetical protein